LGGIHANPGASRRENAQAYLMNVDGLSAVIARERGRFSVSKRQ
jgi:hypothetical protein